MFPHMERQALWLNWLEYVWGCSYSPQPEAFNKKNSVFHSGKRNDFNSRSVNVVTDSEFNLHTSKFSSTVLQVSLWRLSSCWVRSSCLTNYLISSFIQPISKLIPEEMYFYDYWWGGTDLLCFLFCEALKRQMQLQLTEVTAAGEEITFYSQM